MIRDESLIYANECFPCGAGVEALFKSITSLLVEKKDKIERERVLRRKNSVMLTDPTKDGQVDAEGKNKGYGCCA